MRNLYNETLYMLCETRRTLCKDVKIKTKRPKPCTVERASGSPPEKGSPEISIQRDRVNFFENTKSTETIKSLKCLRDILLSVFQSVSTIYLC